MGRKEKIPLYAKQTEEGNTGFYLVGKKKGKRGNILGIFVL